MLKLQANQIKYILFFIIFLLFSACNNSNKIDPKFLDQNSAEYHETAKNFYIGLAALQTGDYIRAQKHLTLVNNSVTQESAAWANLAVLALRQQETEKAISSLQKAYSISPDNSQINEMLGILSSQQNKPEEALSYLRQAIKLDSKNIKATYLLAQELEKQVKETEAVTLLEAISNLQKDNLALNIELARLAAKTENKVVLTKAINQISEAQLPIEARQQIDSLLKKLVNEPKTQNLISDIIVLRNFLVRTPQYRQAIAIIKSPTGVIADPINHFLKLPNPIASPSAIDDGLRFTTSTLPINSNGWAWVGPLLSEGKWTSKVLLAKSNNVDFPDGSTLAFPGNSSSTPTANSILWLDFSYDFKLDLVLAGQTGVKLFKQTENNKFEDVTAKIPTNIASGSYFGAWAADIESDGDLDIVLAPINGLVEVLRNNGDGTFKTIEPFANANNIRAFVWSDIDGDGDIDASMINDKGELVFFSNERASQFKEIKTNLNNVAAINTADIDHDGIMDLVALKLDGSLVWLSYKDQNWKLSELTRWTNAPSGFNSETARLLIADLDNNGSVDLLVSAKSTGTKWTGQIWLSDEKGLFQALNEPPQIQIFSVADLNGDGRLDLVGLSETGEPMQMISSGKKDYKWKDLQPRAATAIGDQRINTFGIGGEVEIRLGLLTQKQPVSLPYTHFGLGEQTDIDIVRVLWPNGFVQALFEVKSDLPLVFDQRLEGSCPFLFAYNGKNMEFVTDFIWRSPLGLRINAQTTADILQTEDWVKISANQLVPKDGFYDVRITAELWETHFFDHVALMTVDHPSDREIYVDERFAIPQPPLEAQSMTIPKPVTSATDDTGQDVTKIISELDKNYLDTFGRGQYQGITREHYVEIELGSEVPQDKPLLLVCQGWIHPTDTSVNIALSQANTIPQSLKIEVPDGKGAWKVAKSNLGFPSGKNKTILLDISDIFTANAPRRLRLATNLEVFWDSIKWAIKLPNTELKTTKLELTSAELCYRGFSYLKQVNKSSPELPEYSPLLGTLPIWRDLEGYYTRFGKVEELLNKVDDRYVIMNAGDELRFKFLAPAPPPTGWTRDFIMIGDGWVKDGNFNTTFSKTVLPLPSHSQPSYNKPVENLENDPVFKRNSEDWQKYHTRYIGAEPIVQTLR